jgi:hypothetical protein
METGSESKPAAHSEQARIPVDAQREETSTTPLVYSIAAWSPSFVIFESLAPMPESLPSQPAGFGSVDQSNACGRESVALRPQIPKASAPKPEPSKPESVAAPPIEWAGAIAFGQIHQSPAAIEEAGSAVTAPAPAIETVVRVRDLSPATETEPAHNRPSPGAIDAQRFPETRPEPAAPPAARIGPAAADPVEFALIPVRPEPAPGDVGPAKRPSAGLQNNKVEASPHREAVPAVPMAAASSDSSGEESFAHLEHQTRQGAEEFQRQHEPLDPQAAGVEAATPFPSAPVGSAAVSESPNPERPTAPAETRAAEPELRAQPQRLSSLAIQVEDHDGARVDLRVRTSQERVEMAVSTQDPSLSGDLRRRLPELAAAVERQGYELVPGAAPQNTAANRDAFTGNGSRSPNRHPHSRQNRARRPSGEAFEAKGDGMNEPRSAAVGSRGETSGVDRPQAGS